MDCNNSDRDALLKIKEQLGNPSELSSWLPATNCCAWDNSIICSETGRVYLVALFQLNVTAPIPSAYGDLLTLQTIQLDTMPGLLTGLIPEDYAHGDIDTIDLSHNQFTGDPSFLFDIAKPMTKIDLSWNELAFDMTKLELQVGDAAACWLPPLPRRAILRYSAPSASAPVAPTVRRARCPGRAVPSGRPYSREPPCGGVTRGLAGVLYVVTLGRDKDGMGLLLDRA
ncbi:hypothetical protein BAE44_0022284 [Dichanthelium oligosanthes]|uniref:Leucine-rich repeat-containing N-terminal plant-type domain-containing protein n=1 Tax=Dichanthelium oligosanthes TaxID=888268 RepID=A0A1E5UV53_9POAL|nr:hypothetical protein BAE44_0022284 [Dichanthelium oligosanthes]